MEYSEYKEKRDEILSRKKGLELVGVNLKVKHARARGEFYRSQSNLQNVKNMVDAAQADVNYAATSLTNVEIEMAEKDAEAWLVEAELLQFDDEWDKQQYEKHKAQREAKDEETDTGGADSG